MEVKLGVVLHNVVLLAHVEESAADVDVLGREELEVFTANDPCTFEV